MLTGVFKDRSTKERGATEEQALAELLAARELRSFTLTRHCEIGPFVVEYLFPEHSLIVELASVSTLDGDSPTARRQAARTKFINDMGYVVLAIEPRELMGQPRRVLARLLTILSKGP
jgi:very-short-patch-repair endonuclease